MESHGRIRFLRLLLGEISASRRCKTAFDIICLNTRRLSYSNTPGVIRILHKLIDRVNIKYETLLQLCNEYEDDPYSTLGFAVMLKFPRAIDTLMGTRDSVNKYIRALLETECGDVESILEIIIPKCDDEMKKRLCRTFGYKLMAQPINSSGTVVDYIKGFMKYLGDMIDKPLLMKELMTLKFPSNLVLGACPSPHYTQ